MKFMLNQLNKFVDLSNKSNEEIINIFTSLAFEVESIKPASQVLGSKLVKTFDKIKHPNADSLSFLKTKINKEIFEVVCGAKNIDSNQIVAHAIPGSKVNNLVIKPKEIRGIVSNGMILSISEIIGIDKDYIDDEEYKNILTFPSTTKLNNDVNKLLEIDQDVIELDILPDRQYASNYFAMAREVASYLGIEYKWNIKEIKSKIPTNINIKLGEDANAIFATNAIINQNIKTPMWIKIVLYYSNIKPKNDISDLSSYVMLMSGAVTYITKRVKDVELRGRKLNNIDIFNSTSKLTNSSEVTFLTISSKKKSNFMVEKNLDKVFGLKQIKGTTIEAAELSSKLFISLANEIGYIKTLNKTISKLNYKNKIFDLKPDYIFNYLGAKFDLEKVKDKLRRLGFIINNNTYIAPSYRNDIEHKADIIEEISRFYGIEKIKPTSYPLIKSKKFKSDPHKDLMIKIINELIKYGLNEIKTYQLITNDQAKKYNVWNQEKFIRLKKEYSLEFNTLQTSLLSGLINTFKLNYRNKKEDIRLFELSNIFHNQKEKYSIGILHDSKIYINEPILATKELVLKALESTGIDISKISFKNKEYNIFNKYISSSILFNKKIIGVIGEIHPSILREHKFIRLDKIKTKLYYAELKLEELFNGNN